jgi:hypothetical protein
MYVSPPDFFESDNSLESSTETPLENNNVHEHY